MQATLSASGSTSGSPPPWANKSDHGTVASAGSLARTNTTIRSSAISWRWGDSRCSRSSSQMSTLGVASLMPCTISGPAHQAFIPETVAPIAIAAQYACSHSG